MSISQNNCSFPMRAYESPQPWAFDPVYSTRCEFPPAKDVWVSIRRVNCLHNRLAIIASVGRSCLVCCWYRIQGSELSKIVGNNSSTAACTALSAAMRGNQQGQNIHLSSSLTSLCSMTRAQMSSATGSYQLVQKYNHLIFFYKNAKNIYQGKRQPLQQMVLEKLNSHMKNKTRSQSFILYRSKLQKDQRP